MDRVQTIAFLAALLTYRYPGPISYQNRIEEAQELLRQAEKAVAAEQKEGNA